MIHKSIAFSAVLGIVGFTVSPSDAATIHVPADAPTIATGLAMAASGDQVVVACGTYSERDLAIPSGVTLRSETGAADCVVIDAQTTGRCLVLTSTSASTRIEGITFVNGRALVGSFLTGDRYDDLESRLASPPDAEVDDAIVERSMAAAGGGAGAYLENSTATFASCVFRNNASFGNGGAVRAKSSAPSFVDCRFESNRSTLNGGALSLELGASATLTRCELRDNRGRHGGAVWISQIGTALIQESVFIRNVAGWSTGQGNGGGVAAVGGTTRIENGTFSHNSAEGKGGGVHATSSAQMVLDATIISMSLVGAAVECESGSGLTMTCSNLNRNAGGDYVGCAAGLHLANGNVSVDPMFCDAVAGEVSLGPTSFCLASNNPCGRLIGAKGMGCTELRVSTVITTWPEGLLVEIDSVQRTTPATVNWVAGSVHTIGTYAVQPGGANYRYVFDDWSDEGSTFHTVVASYNATQYVAYFNSQYWVTTNAGEGGTVSPESGWMGGGTFFRGIPSGAEWAFDRWVGSGSGSYSGTEQNIWRYVYGPITQTAYFSQDVRSLTVQSAGQGTVTPASGPQTSGHVVALTATPAPGWYFANWTGTGNGSYTGFDRNASVTMNDNIVQTAHFVNTPPDFPLTMIAGPNGTVTPSGNHAYSNPVSIIAYPDSGYRFLSWEGVGDESFSGTANPALIYMYGPITETATFGPISSAYTLTMSASTGGTATPTTSTYAPGTPVTVTAIPSPGFVFLRWEGAGGNFNSVQFTNPHVVTMTSHITRHAVFALGGAPFTISMIAPPLQGTVTPATGTYPALANVTIRATPTPLTTFYRWTGSGPGSYSGAQNPATVVVRGPITQTAQFRPIRYTVNMVAVAHGTVSNQGVASRNAGSSVEIFATPNPNCEFAGWTGTGVGSYTGFANPGKITVLGPITQTATFVPTAFELQMLASPGGTVIPSTSLYPVGAVVPIEAFPDSGLTFFQWSGTGTGSYTGHSRVASVTMLAPITQVAHFTHGVPITIESDPSGLNMLVDGQSIVTPHVFDWSPQSFHSVSADSISPIDVDSRYEFFSWSHGLDRVHTYYVPDFPTLLTAYYALQYVLTVTPDIRGTTVPATGWRNAGAALSVTATANPNFAFESWTGSGDGSYSGDANPAPITMSGPITQTASYHAIGFDFSISASATDPFVNVAAPAGGVRSLHLWSTCAEAGLSAFQGILTGSLVPIAFVPANGCFNIGSTTNLLLAVAGCPTGSSIAARLGEWIVIDTGGDLCFAPSTPTALFAAVDCDSIAPSVVTNPRVLGYSSSGAAPCVLNVNPCSSSGPPPAADLSMLRSGDIAAAALPLTDSFVGVSPNPFEGTTEIRFSTATARPAEVAIYDVTGRLVRRIVDGTLPAGEHRLVWDGRNAGGERAPSGVYFLRLQSGPLERTEKIVSIGGR